MQLLQATLLVSLAAVCLGQADNGFACSYGPTFWCRNSNGATCDVANYTVGVAGYSTRAGIPQQTIGDFCATNANTTRFAGGLNGNLPLYEYSVLALYWAPTSCSATNSSGGGFCSNYTRAGSYASQNLVLHGLWPDYGSDGLYQGFPQFCNKPGAYNTSQCSIDGNFCPTKNANTTQTEYENCIRANNVTQCQVGQDTISLLTPMFARYAPGYLGSNYSFLDHEFFKHATCFGNELSTDQTLFFTTALALTIKHTLPGTVAHDFIAAAAGRNVTYKDMVTRLNGVAAPQCNTRCQLSEVWYCVGRDADGYPTDVMQCTAAELAADNCVKCLEISIPAYPSTGTPSTAASG
jgi:ribonuclease I